MTQPNSQQAEYWNEVSGPKWVAHADLIDEQIAPIGLEAIERAAPASGERVLDLGCGCGQTTVELARRVGDEGEVRGIDLSGPMLADARRRAKAQGLQQVRFDQADAQVCELPAGHFDLAFSRFGVMFFDDPVAAFANVRRGVAPGGRLCFAAWQEITKNPWMVAPAMSAAKHAALPERPAEGAPGPFAFADAKRVEGILADAGWRDVEHASVERELAIGAGRALDDIVDFALQMGPAGAAMRDASAEVRAAVHETAVADLSAFYEQGALRLPGAAWIFTATTPG